jgi:hypothetical protein
MNQISFVGKISAVMPIIMVLITFVPAVSPGSDPVPQLVEYESAGNYFRCKIPANWSVYEPGFGLSAEEKKVYGINLFGPRDGSPVVPVISIHYFAPGNLLHKSMEVFIRRHSGPVLGFVAEGKSYGEVREAELAGRKAQVFERIDIRFIGERALNPLKVSIFEKFVVVPDGKNVGFYVLKLSVPANALFADTPQKGASPFFDKVKVRRLSSKEETTRENILKELKGMRSLNPDDLFVFYVASHGTVDDGEYFLITSNVGSTRTERLKTDAIGQSVFRGFISNIPATKKLIIIDTCNAGALGEASRSRCLRAA